MSNLRVSDTATLVRLLVEGGVEFIVVGMSAAVFLGVPATTLDLTSSKAVALVLRLEKGKRTVLPAETAALLGTRTLSFK